MSCVYCTQLQIRKQGALTTSLESLATDRLTDSGYKTNLNKVSLGTRYEQFDDLFSDDKKTDDLPF